MEAQNKTITLPFSLALSVNFYLAIYQCKKAKNSNGHMGREA